MNADSFYDRFRAILNACNKENLYQTLTKNECFLLYNLFDFRYRRDINELGSYHFFIEYKDLITVVRRAFENDVLKDKGKIFPFFLRITDFGRSDQKYTNAPELMDYIKHYPNLLCEAFKWISQLKLRDEDALYLVAFYTTRVENEDVLVQMLKHKNHGSHRKNKTIVKRLHEKNFIRALECCDIYLRNDV